MRDRTLVVTASVLATATVFQQWMLRLAGSALFILAMLSVGLPGAWLLGPMVAGVVAFMQYPRVICVAFLASLIARFWIGSTGTIRSDQVYFPALRLVPLAETLAIAGFGVTLERWKKIPSGL